MTLTPEEHTKIYEENRVRIESKMSLPDMWISRLANAIAEAIREFASHLNDEPIVLLAVDCHPWHGTLGLSALTVAEANDDPLLVASAEMAAWKHYDFTSTLTAWRPVAGLAEEMKIAYEAGSGPVIIDIFLCDGDDFRSSRRGPKRSATSGGIPNECGASRRQPGIYVASIEHILRERYTPGIR